MTFTEAEVGYLKSQQLGRLATVQPDGSPQVKPVGFHYNEALGTIDVTGFNLSTSQKFRNVGRNGLAALVVDDIASTDPWRVRFLEIRGTAEAVPATGTGDPAVIRIRPSRILSFGVEEPPREPHLTTLRTRNLLRPRQADRLVRFASSSRSADHGGQAGPWSGGRQDERVRATHTGGHQPRVDRGYRMVVPFGHASHADRVWADA
jgi:pyridoxamine 5'-phosphate oxidase family protein